MAAQTLLPPSAAEQFGTTKLYLSSANGPVYRTVLKSPLRDADASEIPIIDVSGIFSSSLADRAQVAAQIRHAATNMGFFYIKNHGIPSETSLRARDACLDFFRQPLETKQLANSSQSQFFNGYKPPKTQQLNPTESIDVREAFSWQYDPRYDPDVSDVSSIPPHIGEQLRCEDFHWEATANLPSFKEAVVAHWQGCLRLARALVRAFALSLDLPEDFFAEKFSHPDANLSLNYYPPIVKPSSPKGQGSEADEVSIGSHTDFQLFTILWQDDNGGLQVLNRQGQWINARPVPGTFVVNIADYLQRITNDRYVSTVHRAQNWSGNERISMPFFFGFNLNESCGVLDSCVAEGEKKKYDEISCVEWVRRRAQMMHNPESAKSAD